MNYLDAAKNLPKKWLMVGGAGLAGFIAWSYLRGNGSQQQVQVVDNTVPYDMALVQLGTEASLQRDAMANTLELAKLSSKTELDLATVDSNTTLGLAQMDYTLQDKALNLDSAYNHSALYQEAQSHALDKSTEMQLATMRYNLSNREIDLATGEQAQKYNLANYQAKIQHDLGKKNIKANQFTALANVALGAFKAVI